MSPPTDTIALDDVLVLAVRKSFWSSEECRIFPRRVYAPVLHGYSQNALNTFVFVIQGICEILNRRPRLILFGSQSVIPWFIGLKRLGLLRGIRMVAINQFSFSDRAARRLDRIIVYSRGEIALHDPAIRDRYVFIPLPADGDFSSRVSSEPGPYLFSGGGEQRDYPSLIQAIRGLDIRLVIVTWSRKSLGIKDPLPTNCEYHSRMPLQNFLNLMAGALFVVVPLKPGGGPHGQTTIVQAQRLGKTVITTQDSSVEDYVLDGQNGFLVRGGDVDSYRNAILRLLKDQELRQSMETQARRRLPDSAYSAYAERLVRLCREALR